LKKIANRNCFDKRHKLENKWLYLEPKRKKMANEKQIHVTRTTDRTWKVKRTNRTKAVRVLSTQEEAIQVARSIAENNGLYLTLHRPNGQFRALDSRL
jgi:hypothetical protein